MEIDKSAAPPTEPSTVAFLFTDVEGSTARWEADAAEARLAMERQEALIRRLVEVRGGRVFKIVGDGVCAAFTATADTLDAALDAQLVLRTSDDATAPPVACAWRCTSAWPPAASNLTQSELPRRFVLSPWGLYLVRIMEEHSRGT